MNQSSNPPTHHLFLTWYSVTPKHDGWYLLRARSPPYIPTYRVSIYHQESNVIQHYHPIHRLHLHSKISRQHPCFPFWSRVPSRTHAALRSQPAALVLFTWEQLPILPCFSHSFYRMLLCSECLCPFLTPSQIHMLRPNLQCEVFRYVALGRWLGPGGRALISVINAL